MREIYLLLSYSGSVPSHLIHYYTKDPYAHASISLDKELKEMYSFARLKPNNPVIAGFVHEDLENGTFKKFHNATCRLYALNVSDGQYRKLLAEITKFKHQRQRYSYNFIGVFGAIFNRPIEREFRYFCSQFVATVLHNSDIRIVEKPPGLTKPMDFAEHEELKLIYEGRLHDYPQVLKQSVV